MSGAGRPVADVFFDGQNLFHSVKSLFGYRHPNFDIAALAEALCTTKQWCTGKVHFYTGMPKLNEDPAWHAFWSAKLAVMGRQGVRIFNPELRYRDRMETRPDGSMRTFRVPQEKGVDVRIAIDIIRAAHEGSCGAMIIVSQDSDLREAAVEARRIAKDAGRSIEMASAFPIGAAGYSRGIDTTSWIPFDKALYDNCIDTRNYLSRRSQTDQRDAQRATRAREILESPAAVSHGVRP